MISPENVVVAVVVQWREKIALFRRSQRPMHDSGLWHCITGFVEPGCSPEQQVFQELLEETGLSPGGLTNLRKGPELVILDEQGVEWLVHTFTVWTLRRRLALDWEHDAYRWIAAPKVKRFCNRVNWLDEVLRATGHIEESLLPDSQDSLDLISSMEVRG